MSARSFSFLTIGVVSACLISAFACADEGDKETQSLEYHLKMLLDEGWSIEPSARADAEEHFRQAMAIAPGDNRVYVARSLTLTKQGRYDLAHEAWRRLAKNDPTNLEFQAWKIRVKIISKQHAAALVDMIGLAQSLPEESSDEQVERNAIRYANLLGRLFGYLDGPGAEVAGTNENHRSEARRKVVAALSPTRQQVFEEGRASVIDRFTAFELEQEEELVEGVRAQEAERQRRLQTLAGEQSRVSQDMQNLDSDLRRIRTDQRDEIRDVDRDLTRVESSLSQYESQLNAAFREIDILRREVSRLQISLDAEEDPTRRILLRDELRRLEILLVRRDSDYHVNEREAYRLNDSRISLQRERQRIGNLYEDQAKDIERNLNSLRKQERRLRNEMLDAERPPTGVNARVRSIKSKAAAYTTYDQFPLEIEKAELLESFREE